MLRLGISVLAMTLCLGCSDTWYEDPPNDHPYYPSALIQNQDTLFVLGSNFDQRYSHGNVMSVDLLVVDAAISQAPNAIITNAVTSSAYIHSFPDAATLSPRKDQIIFASREQRSIRRIPLSNFGTQIACPNASTALGQDCFSAQPVAQLDQTNPYYLLFFSDGQQNIEGGIVGFLSDAYVQRANDKGEYRLPLFAEMERFTWNSADSTATVIEDLPLGDKLRPPSQPAPAGRRTNVRIGALSPVGDYLYFLAERPQDSGTMVLVSPQLARVSLAELQSAPLAGMTVSTVDLPNFGMQIAVHSLAVRALPNKASPTSLQFFMTNGGGGTLFVFELSLSDPLDENNRLKVVQRSRAVTCNHPTDIKLSPDQAQVIVACDRGKMLVYDAQTLQAQTLDPTGQAVFGRGPVKLLFDERVTTRPYRFYAANFLDGSVSVFQLLDGQDPNQPVLTRLAHIFQPSPQSRDGGVK